MTVANETRQLVSLEPVKGDMLWISNLALSQKQNLIFVIEIYRVPLMILLFKKLACYKVKYLNAFLYRRKLA